MLTLDEQIARLADHAEQAAAAATELVVVRVDDHRRSAPRRPWVLAAAASVVAIGLAAVALVPRWVEPEPPTATVPPVPSTASRPSVPSTAPPSVEPALPAWSGPRPTLFPALPAGDPRNRAASTASGFFSIGSFDRDVASSASLVGRVVDDELVEGVMVQVFEAPVDQGADWYQVDPVTIAGRTYDAWRMPGGSPVVTTLVDRDDPRIRVSGVDTVGFLGLLGAPPAARIDVRGGVVGVELAELPIGWTTIVPPTPIPPRALIADLMLPPGDGESDVVGVGVIPELLLVGSTVPMRRVDVNGAEGWMTQEAAFAVYWPAGDGTLARAFAATADGALDLARSIEFVDEATWRERYDVGPGEMPMP